MRTLWKRAIIECVPLEDNPEAGRDIEAALRAMGIVEKDHLFSDYREDSDFVRMGGESYGAVFTVQTEDLGNLFFDRKVYAKAVIGGFGEEATAATVRAHVERLHLLSSWGIRTPRVYGFGKGTIYEEFIAGAALEPSSCADIAGLARIAAILDFRGASPLAFLADLMDDGGPLCYVDAGCDLGHIEDGLPPNADRPARRTLLAALEGSRKAMAEKAYDHHYAQGGGQWSNAH